MENLLTVDRKEVPNYLSLTLAPNEWLRKIWSELIGVEKIKQQLLTQMRLSLSSTLLFSWYHRHYQREDPELPEYKRRTLLLGPSGTGKTSLARGLADAYSRETKECVYLVELGLVRSKFVGQTSKNIHDAFEKVKEWSKEHVVVFLLDEFDSLANPRNFEQMHEEIRDAVNTLIREIDRLDSSSVFLIACSNLEGNIDEAVKRRFEEGLVLRFTRPDYNQRLELLDKWLEPFSLNGKDKLEIAKKTKGLTHAYIKSAVKKAVRYAFSEDRPLSLDDLLRAVEEIRPTGDY